LDELSQPHPIGLVVNLKKSVGRKRAIGTCNIDFSTISDIPEKPLILRKSLTLVLRHRIVEPSRFSHICEWIHTMINRLPEHQVAEIENLANAPVLELPKTVLSFEDQSSRRQNCTGHTERELPDRPVDISLQFDRI
jgi:hypothetical protein